MHRYIFLVRQRFGTVPAVDCFYKLVSPSGLSGNEMKVMSTLKPGWEAESLKADTTAMKGMNLRLRFNTDMYQKICLVRSKSEISAEELDAVIALKHNEGELIPFLEESAI